LTLSTEEANKGTNINTNSSRKRQKQEHDKKRLEAPSQIAKSVVVLCCRKRIIALWSIRFMLLDAQVFFDFGLIFVLDDDFRAINFVFDRKL